MLLVWQLGEHLTLKNIALAIPKGVKTSETLASPVASTEIMDVFTNAR